MIWYKYIYLLCIYSDKFDKNRERVNDTINRCCRSTFSDLQLTPEMYNQLRVLQKKAKDLRQEARNLRRMSQAQAHSIRETIKDTFIKIRYTRFTRRLIFWFLTREFPKSKYIIIINRMVCVNRNVTDTAVYSASGWWSVRCKTPVVIS